MNRRSFLILGAASLAARAANANGFAKPPGGKPGSSSLDAWRNALGAARSREIARLRTYRNHGRFPHNHRILGRTPTFIDERGVPCAVGYLMQQSGARDLASTIARTDNNVYIEYIADGPALEWILHSGLTQEECATIQPSYRWRDPYYPVRPPPPPTDDEERQMLIGHFRAVERQLLDQTKTSLDVALERLASRIANGDTLDRVVG
jgi:hypothetical protein